MDQSNPTQPETPIWQAYGPAKEKWKADGNYYSAEELARMAEDFKDLVIKPRAKKIYDAN